MLSIPQYDSLLHHQYNDVENKARKIRIFISADFHFIKRFFVKKGVRKINNFLSSHLLKSKGILSDIESRTSDLKDKDLSHMIKGIDGIIKLEIKLKESVRGSFEKMIHDCPEIENWEPILEETINNLYSTLRILKRQNKKTAIDTSPLAVESSKRSLTSLQTATYDRRPT